MTYEHKNALRLGREQGRKVTQYLKAIEAHRPKRGRKRTVESVERDIVRTEEALQTAQFVERLALLQKRRDLAAELEQMNKATDIAPLEKDFIEVAKSYSERTGYTYDAWKDYGVSPEVLKKAGITK